jgi:hypothetical protein
MPASYHGKLGKLLQCGQARQLRPPGYEPAVKLEGGERCACCQGSDCTLPEALSLL